MKEDKRGGRKPAPVPTGPATGDKRTHLEWDRLLLSMLRKPESRWQSAAASNGIVCFFLRMAQSGSPSAIGGNFQ